MLQFKNPSCPNVDQRFCMPQLRPNGTVKQINNKKKIKMRNLKLKVMKSMYYGQGSLAGYSPWGRKKLDMTEQLN